MVVIHGSTHLDIANRLGVSLRYVSRMLSVNTNFSFKALQRLSVGLGYRVWMLRLERINGIHNGCYSVG